MKDFVSSLGYDPLEIENTYFYESHSRRFSKGELFKKTTEVSNPPHLAMVNSLKKAKDSGSFTTLSQIKSKTKLIIEPNGKSPITNKVKNPTSTSDRLGKGSRGSQDNIKGSLRDDKDRSDMLNSILKRQSEKASSCLSTPHKSQRVAHLSHCKDADSLAHKGVHSTVKIKDVVSKR